MYKNLIIVLFLTNSLFAISPFLENKGIVDIGTKTATTEIEVPMEYIYTEANQTIIDNEIIYLERLQSELFDCEIDFLETQTCPHGITECPSYEEFDDGYSTKHHVVKSFVKICPASTVQSAQKCYEDSNNNGISDYLKKINYEYVLSNSGSSSPAGWGGLLASYNISVGDYTYKFYAPKNDKYKVRIQTDNYATIDIDNNQIHSDTSDYWGEESPKYVDLNSGEHTIKISAKNYAGPHGVAVAIYDSSDDLLWNTRSGQILEYNECKEGFIAEGDYCYIASKCPDNTTEQSDGSCKMEYDWYSYHCYSDSNYYTNTWQVRETGQDCGNPTCTNGPTPPSNNCVRVDYTCPIDGNKNCGKTTASDVDCGVGYVWNDNRCERIETYCGSSTYNAAQDICQNITHYEKLCVNPTDVYDVNKNKCVSNTEICKNGAYDPNTRTCYMSFKAKCELEGYIYDVSTETCIDEDKDICDPQYNYIVSENICKGTMTMCASDEIYNSTSKQCEKSKCGILDTTDSGTQCETNSLCDGIITSIGKCLPNTIQN